jgi:hypothetical protein
MTVNKGSRVTILSFDLGGSAPEDGLVELAESPCGEGDRGDVDDEADGGCGDEDGGSLVGGFVGGVRGR